MSIALFDILAELSILSQNPGPIYKYTVYTKCKDLICLVEVNVGLQLTCPRFSCGKSLLRTRPHMFS